MLAACMIISLLFSFFLSLVIIIYIFLSTRKKIIGVQKILISI